MKKNNVFAITIGIISLFSANVYTACLDSRASLTDVARDPYEYANRVKKALSNKDYKALDILLDPNNMIVQGPTRESGKHVLQTQLQLDPKFTLNGALFEAIHRGDLNLVKYVVNKGAGVDYEHSMFTSTPIEYAKELADERDGSFIAVYNYLKNEKTKELYDAIEKQDIQAIEAYLTLHPESINSEHNGLNVLDAAIYTKNPDLVSYFIDKNIDVNQQRPFGTALTEAMFLRLRSKDNPKDSSNMLAIIKLLINNNADIEGDAERIKTPPLYRAAETGDYEVVKLLLNAGADNKRTQNWISGPLDALGGAKKARDEIRHHWNAVNLQNRIEAQNKVIQLLEARRGNKDKAESPPSYDE